MVSPVGFLMAKEPNFWKNRENRVNAVRELVGSIGGDPRKLKYIHFKKGRIEQVLLYYGYRTDLALADAGYRINPWEMDRQVPRGYWKDRKTRKEAVLWLIAKTGKPPERLTRDDFMRHGLGGLFIVYGGQEYALRNNAYRLYNAYPMPVMRALADAGVKFRRAGVRTSDGKKPYLRLPPGYWNVRKNRRNAIRSLVEYLGGDPLDIVAEDFERAGFSCLFRKYGSSPLNALRDAGYRVRTLDRRSKPHRYWTSRAKRKNAYRKFVLAALKGGDRITEEYLAGKRLGGLCDTMGNSTYRLLRDTGVRFNPWESMGHSPPGYWKSRKNRVRAVRWLCSITRKPVLQLKMNDYIGNRLGGLYTCYSSKRRARFSGLLDIFIRYDSPADRVKADVR
jgi:hypothetical protein